LVVGFGVVVIVVSTQWHRRIVVVAAARRSSRRADQGPRERGPGEARWVGSELDR
jgi:hypothetical protein